MPIHDAYARVTPYELALPGEGFAEEHFGALAEEAAARDSDAGDPGDFAMLMAAGQALRELRGPDEDAERIREHATLLYHAYHFWRGGRPVLLLETGVVRSLVSDAAASVDAADWTPCVPHASAYVQLPQHLVWVPGQSAARGVGPDEGSGEGSGDGGEEGNRGGVAESVDGFFWTVSGGSVSFLLALGLRSDRPGFGVVALPTVPLSEATLWIREKIRPEGGDFSSDLPGAELEDLYEVRTAGEVLKLAGRVLWLLDRGSWTSHEVDPTAQSPPGPRPSALPYRRLTLE
jgi:hypothetical protein